MSLTIILLTFVLVDNCAGAPFASKLFKVEDDPELTPGYFEGDMLFADERIGRRNDSFRWPNNTVYYKFSTEFDEPHRNHLLRGMRMIEEVSCILFKEADETQTYYVEITGNPKGCFSNVGWLNRVQNLNVKIFPLDRGCFILGKIIHEFLHTLGLYHMQSVYYRDDYVQIVEENIQEGKAHAFQKIDYDKIDDFDQGYDYASLMHYGPYAFSVNGERTIVPLKEEGKELMGQRRGMSEKDINRLNLMYRCPIKIQEKF